MTTYEKRITDAKLLQQLDALKPLLKAAVDVRNEFIRAGGGRLRQLGPLRVTP